MYMRRELIAWLTYVQNLASGKLALMSQEQMIRYGFESNGVGAWFTAGDDVVSLRFPARE